MEDIFTFVSARCPSMMCSAKIRQNLRRKALPLFGWLIGACIKCIGTHSTVPQLPYNSILEHKYSVYGTCFSTRVSACILHTWSLFCIP